MPSTEAQKVPPKRLGMSLRVEDGTIWPDPREAGEIAYQLRYGPGLTREQQFTAASVIEAWRYLLLEPSLTQKRRTEKIRFLLNAIKETSDA